MRKLLLSIAGNLNFVSKNANCVRSSKEHNAMFSFFFLIDNNTILLQEAHCSENSQKEQNNEFKENYTFLMVQPIFVKP